MGTVRVLDSAPSESRGPGTPFGRWQRQSPLPGPQRPKSQPGCLALRHCVVVAQARAGRNARAGRGVLGAAGPSRAHGSWPRGWGWSLSVGAATRSARPDRTDCAG